MNIGEILKSFNANDCKELTNEERINLFMLKDSGDELARDLLCKDSFKLVASILMKEFHIYENVDDVFLEGCAGLLKAIDSFDVNRGIEFSSYAYPTIKGTVLNYLNGNDSVHITRRAKDLAIKVHQYKNEFFTKEHRYPKTEEIADKFNVEKDLVIAASYAISPVSIDASHEADVDLEGNSKDFFDDLFQKTQDYENKFGFLSAKTIDAYLDLTNKLKLKDNFDPEKKQFNERDATKSVNASFEHQIESERNLLNQAPITWLSSWILKLKEINPNRYYNRLIANLNPNSDFAKEAAPSFFNLSPATMRKRNKLIRNAVQDNMRDSEGNQIKSIKISPDYTYNNIINVLTRDDRMFKVDDVRGIVFLTSLAFNLDYDETEELLMHCLGERKIDFKNPYEVMLAYCLIKDRGSCEHYIELRKKYESYDFSNFEDFDEDRNTTLYENEFWNIDNDEDLLDFLVCLPNNDSQSAKKVFQENIDIIRAELSKDDEGLFDILNVYLDSDVDPQIKGILKKAIGISDSTLEKIFFGDEFSKEREGLFQCLRKQVFNIENLNSILSGITKVTKEQLLLVIFFRYCLSEKYATIKNNLISDKSNQFVKKIYYSFKSFANPILEKAGFDFVYLPNFFESFLMFCLVCDEPLETFKMIMMYTN